MAVYRSKNHAEVAEAESAPSAPPPPKVGAKRHIYNPTFEEKQLEDRLRQRIENPGKYEDVTALKAQLDALLAKRLPPK